jgi:hypothetical protein
LPLGWGIISVEDAMRIQLPFAVLFAVVFAFSMHAAPAQAQRVFVSATGSDGNPCSFASPCRSFQHAHDTAPAGGEIDVLDPAGYGAVTITKAISIQGHGFSGITVASGANGITINAGSTDAVTLNGLLIDGAGVGSNGIVFNSGDNLVITNCLAQNFFHSSYSTGDGILIQPTSGTINFVISDTVILNNAFIGIFYYPPSGSPTANGVIDHVTAEGNAFGISISQVSMTGGSSVIAISNTTLSANSSTGLQANNGSTTPLTLSIDNVSAIGNAVDGISVFDTTEALLGRSVITGNGTGIDNSTSPNTFYTYKDNRINKNGTNISSALNTTLTVQ